MEHEPRKGVEAMTTDIKRKIMDLFKEHGQISQGLVELGIEGRRGSDMRFMMYRLGDYLKPYHKVLDIGCNCGFLDCLIAKRVSAVLGVDKDPTLIKIARIATKATGVASNTHFVNDDFNDFHDGEGAKHRKTFDLVMSCEMHMWVRLPFETYITRAASYIKTGGVLLFESHDTDNVDKDIIDKINIIKSKGFRQIWSGSWLEDPGKYWIPPKQHKKIPRQFCLLKLCE